MQDIRDPSYLEREQYKDASLLNARIHLHQRFSTNQYGWFRWIFDQLNLPINATLLEIGCDPGTLWLENRGRIPIDWQITLSDFSPRMVQEAKRVLGFGLENYYFISSNAMPIPLHEDTFDIIVANHMLYHVPDRQKAIGEINRVIKPNGRFKAATNGKNHLQELSVIIDNCSSPLGRHYSPDISMGGFTLDNGTEQLSPWFSRLEIYHYQDALVITEARPLVDFILSMIPAAEINLDINFESRLSTFIDNLIKRQGSIHMQKSTGLIMGVKKEPI